MKLALVATLLLVGSVGIARAAPLGVLQQVQAAFASPTASGGPRLRAVTLESVDGRRSSVDVGQLDPVIDPRAARATFAAPWGRVQITLRSTPTVATMDVEVVNLGTDIIRGIDLQLMTVVFPATPKNFDGDPRLTHNRDAPAILRADLGDQTVRFTNDEPGRAVLFGFPHSVDRPANRTYPLIVSTQQIGWLQGPHLLDPYLDRPIYPGGADRFRFSVRVGDGDVVERAFARAFPPTLKWDDRRPIGMVMMSSSAPEFQSAKNPRGWFNDPALDVRSPAFARRVMDRARETIAVARDADAQGVVVWDIEGQEFPHATSYIGDPRSLPPEMDAVADAFFKALVDAGLKVGVCIRPQVPVRSAYGSSVEQRETPDPAQTLIDKVAHARQRWGATLFYVDSNGDPNVPFDAAIFERVAAAHPDVLLMPEHQAARYYRSTAPYEELRSGTAATPSDVRAMYPRAFSVIAVNDGDVTARRAELVQAVRAGDILMSRMWWPDGSNADVKSIYAQARR